MPVLELTRTPEDRRVYSLEGIGTLQILGWLGRSATAQAGGRTWRISSRGLFRRITVATNPAGGTSGEFEPNTMRRGGRLAWAGEEFALRPASVWRERYALVDGDRELATFEGKGWGKRPVKVTVEDPGALNPGLLLFAAFVVRNLAEDAGSSAAVGATAATGGGS
jgi:hypothetical protein